LAVAATKHLELLKQKDEAESSFIIEKIVGKLLNRTLDLFLFRPDPPNSGLGNRRNTT
jgi:hypothetical protein